jgi:glycosyltransferase involved in cell wall biosynthesis
VVHFGLVIPRKGLEEFLEFARLARAEGLTWEFVIVGKVAHGRADYAKALMERSQPFQVQWVLDGSAEQVSRRLAQGGLAYLPFPDGASERRGSLKAALAAGVPCITTRTGQTPKQMEGVVEFASTPAEALNIARRLMSAGEERERMSRAALAYAQEFTWEKIAEAHLRMYRELERRSS